MGERMYAWGESAKAEMCDMFCRTLGRGHVHLAACTCAAGSPSGSSSSGPFVLPPRPTGGRLARKHVDDAVAAYSVQNRRLDETMHDEYWRSVGWADPCMPEEQASFRKCAAVCTVASHRPDGGGGGDGDDGDQDVEEPALHCCAMDVFHAPLDPRAPPAHLGPGYVSRDGHFFTCSQRSPAGAGYHVIFVADASGSMSTNDATPADGRISALGLNNRLGCVIEACDRFVGLRHRAGALDRVSLVLFGSIAATAIEFQPISANMIMDIAGGVRHHRIGGGTSFDHGFQAALGVMQHAATPMPTLLMFLTDGDGTPPTAILQQIRLSHADIEMRSIGFGAGYNVASLRSVAGVFGARGSVLEAVDESMLVQEFEATAEQLCAKIGVLLQDN